MEHLEGETVAILADGVELASQVVSGGEITLPGSVTANKVQVGIPYTPLVEPMRVDITTGSGSTHGSLGKIGEIAVSLKDSADVLYGATTDNLFSVDLSDVKWTNSSSITGLFTGDVVMSFPGGYDRDNPILITASGPMPLDVRCIVARIEVQGR